MASQPGVVICPYRGQHVSRWNILGSSALNTSERGVHWRFAGHSFGAFYRAMLAANTITEMVATKSGRVTILFLAQPINQKITSIKHYSIKEREHKTKREKHKDKHEAREP